MYWTKLLSVDGGASREEEKKKTSVEVHGCCEGGHAEDWYDRGG